jgi:hypothetical protein
MLMMFASEFNHDYDWNIFNNNSDLDPSQVVMVQRLSDAVRSAMKVVDTPSTKIGLQKLMQWYAIESASVFYVTDNRNNRGCCLNETRDVSSR